MGRVPCEWHAACCGERRGAAGLTSHNLLFLFVCSGPPGAPAHRTPQHSTAQHSAAQRDGARRCKTDKLTHLHVLAGAGDTGQTADAAASDCCCDLLAGQADGTDDSCQLCVNVALALLLWSFPRKQGWAGEGGRDVKRGLWGVRRGAACICMQKGGNAIGASLVGL